MRNSSERKSTERSKFGYRGGYLSQRPARLHWNTPSRPRNPFAKPVPATDLPSVTGWIRRCATCRRTGLLDNERKQQRKHLTRKRACQVHRKRPHVPPVSGRNRPNSGPALHLLPPDRQPTESTTRADVTRRTGPGRFLDLTRAGHAILKDLRRRSGLDRCDTTIVEVDVLAGPYTTARVGHPPSPSR